MRCPHGTVRGARWSIVALCNLAMALAAQTALAQLGGGLGGGGGGGGGVGGGTGSSFSFNNVGGVYVDTAGMLQNADVDVVGRLRAMRREALAAAPTDMQQPTDVRKVSLRELEAALAQHLRDGRPIDDAFVYLAGLQRIRYVFVYPESHDIVIAGPAEGWRVDDHGTVVGQTTGRPVMLLEDLLVALRSAPEASRSPISCSIDPTQAGLARLKQFLDAQQSIGPRPEETLTSIEDSLGPQAITITGVPATSRFARVLVAADYRMKRLAMGFERSPVSGLPSFLNLLKSQGGPPSGMMPRWWLAMNYQPLLADPAGLAWEFRAGSVQVLTEEEFVSADGRRQGTGQANPTAAKWADLMNERYDELSSRLPVFGELVNLMDLALVAALVHKEGLTTRVGASFPLLTEAGPLSTAEVPAPQQVPTQASFVKQGRNYIISASGGVEINSWQAIDQREANTAPAEARRHSPAPLRGRWWWN